MELFERAHIVKPKLSKNKKLTESKKKQLKQMLFGYKVNDNKLIQKSTDFQNDYDDSTSVSGFSDLNLTNSSFENDVNTTFTRKEHRNNRIIDTSEESKTYTISKINSEENSNDSISECSEGFKSNEYVSDNGSPQSNIISDDDSINSSSINGSIPECNENIVSSESNDTLSGEFDETVLDSCSDDEPSVAVGGLNLTESDISESFDADGQLAAKIQQKLLIKKNKQKHKCKYYIEVDDVPVTIANENFLQRKPKTVQHPISEDDSSVESDVQNNDYIESNISLPYVSITASDMSTQKLNDIIGEYKHSTVRNIPIENQNLILSTNNSGFFIEESMSVDINTEDDVDSLVPELDDIPKLEEIDEELINLDTTTESLDKSLNTNDITVESEILGEKELSGHYANVADICQVYYGLNCCIITLKHPCELFIQGKVKIRSLGGCVEVFGYTLKKETRNIYAPYYNFAQCIKTLENQNDYNGLFGKLTGTGLSVSEAEHIVTTIGENDGVILLQELINRAMDFVENSFKTTSLFQKSNKVIEPFFSKASDLLNCSLFSSRPFKSFCVHPSWSEALEFAENKKSRGIVCGGKGAGKSTYLRYQVNQLLAYGPVLVVDLDPGQSEFTVAGNVSATVVKAPVFGPSFTHLRRPELMLNIGMINTMENAKLYASAVQTLMMYCRSNKAFSDMPWLINTMGMTNALGLKFITLIITLSQPTYVLQYDSKSANQRFETFLTPSTVKDLSEEYRNDLLFANVLLPEYLNYSFVVANSTDIPLKNKYALKPAEERYLNFLAYFSQLLLNSREVSLLGITPYEVSIKDLCIASNVIVKEDYITKVINGKLVALCQHARQCDSVRVFTLSDKPLLCRGHGLIRGVDWEKAILYVITPVPSSELGDVDTLLYADWVPELVGYESRLPLGTTVPYRTTTAEQHKQLMSTPRRRFNPLQLLKMSRSS